MLHGVASRMVWSLILLAVSTNSERVSVAEHDSGLHSGLHRVRTNKCWPEIGMSYEEWSSTKKTEWNALLAEAVKDFPSLAQNKAVMEQHAIDLLTYVLTHHDCYFPANPIGWTYKDVEDMFRIVGVTTQTKNALKNIDEMLPDDGSEIGFLNMDAPDIIDMLEGLSQEQRELTGLVAFVLTSSWTAPATQMHSNKLNLMNGAYMND